MKLPKKKELIALVVISLVVLSLFLIYLAFVGIPLTKQREVLLLDKGI